MEKEERLRIFKTNLSRLVDEGGEGSSVIFDVGEKFIQFAGDEEIGLVCDIPLVELSKEEEERLRALKEFSKGEGARDVDTNELASYQTSYSREEIDKAVELTERIFTDIFGLMNTFDVSVELNLEKK